MNDAPRAPDPYVPNEEERETLRRQWEAGDYAHHVENLLGFVRERRDSIRLVVQGSKNAEDCVAAVRIMLTQLGTIHPPSEMRDQMKAIHDEIWYRGERGEHDRDRIVADWTQSHAAAWRRWRLMEYLFVLDRVAAEVVAAVCPHTSDEQKNLNPKCQSRIQMTVSRWIRAIGKCCRRVFI